MTKSETQHNRNRKTKEATIRVVDLVIYAGNFVCGVFAICAPPESITRELDDLNWLVLLWAILLVLGGLLGFVGRLTRLWAIEIPGTAAAIAGCIIYAVVLAKISATDPTIAVAVALVSIAALTLVRRYIELQIFTYEPDDQGPLRRIRTALMRRTENAVPRKD